MENRNIRKLTLLILLAVLFMACEKWIDPELNVNPDQASEVTMATLLPSIEAQLAYRACGGSDVIGFQSVWLQQMDGVWYGDFYNSSRYVTDHYAIQNFFDGLYSQGMMDATVLMDLAEEQGSPHNQGVAKVCMAAFLGQLTDAFGDIPWSQALQGIKYPRPAYDEQEFIYEEIHRLLEEAIVHLSDSVNSIDILGDFFYNGSETLWLKAAHALKARYHLHLSKRKGLQAYQDALTELESAFTSRFEDMQFFYDSGESESNPLYQFMSRRDEMRLGAYFINLLKETNDPRLPVYALPDAQGAYTGSEPGSGNTEASRPGPGVAEATTPTYVITFAECLFMKAEIAYQLGNDAGQVREVLTLAVFESLNTFGVYDSAWLSGYSESLNSISGEVLFEEIMTQKYIALFYQPEVYHSWRRTGYPVIPPNPTGLEDEIPRRFPYTALELFYNSANTPQGVSITERVWWDE